ncbi:hypothetical protein DSO57_1002885 [Entomophthora muscae]|uniref:Uncharacterized protein n=1 Tax=Entomophthora muscae TaxID=34485 RepID=A0ACC2TX92_9FUNG|nr:hypothetical protein DSO57_1002885 [Entomophthora muscae]
MSIGSLDNCRNLSPSPPSGRVYCFVLQGKLAHSRVPFVPNTKNSLQEESQPCNLH